MIVAGLVAVFALAAVLSVLLAVRRLRRRRYRACAMHGALSLVWILIAACIGLVGADLMTYERLTHEQRALDVSFAANGQQQFIASLVYPSGSVGRVELRGDEWQVDARVLKWRAFANVIGFDTAYRLERIAGRYSDIERERVAPHSVYAINSSGRVDAWSIARALQCCVDWIDASYGSAVYAPMSDGASYRVSVSQSGLVTRPVNEAAARAIGTWRAQ